MLALGNLITNKVQAGFYFFLTFSGKFPPAAKIHYLSIKYSKAFRTCLNFSNRPVNYKTQNQLHPQLPPIALAGGRKL